MNIVEFNDVTFKYDEKTVFSSLNLAIPKGKYTVLLGHNGSGKSTLAKLIIGLMEIESGKILVDGLELNENNLDDIRNKVAIVFQNPDNQFIGSTVEDDIAFGLENRNVPQEQMQGIIEDYANRVGMIEFLKQEPQALSGGQKQRVALAGALSLSPSLLILDEATSMLDPKGKKEINEVINDIKKNNKDMSILAITHHIEEVMLADQIIILNNGKVSAIGTPSEILNNFNLLKDNALMPPFLLAIKEKLKESNIDVGTVNSLDELVDKL